MPHPNLCKELVLCCLNYIISLVYKSAFRRELFCYNVPTADQIALPKLMDMKLGKLPIRYLGVPLISGKLRDIDCQPLIAKIISRTTSWTTNFLSFAGKFQLTDSVLNSMINYWSFVFLLPTKVIKSVERLCSSFLWNGAKVKWRNVCQPETEG